MFLITLIVFIFVIGILVLVHELGHYMAARAVGIKIEEFAIGMGPKIWGFKKKHKFPQDEIEYSLRLLPIGGYVKMYGEGEYDVVTENSFAGKRPSLRLIVLVAGVFMNFLLAAILLYAQAAHQNFRFSNNSETYVGGQFNPWFGDKVEKKVALANPSETSPLKDKIKPLDVIYSINGNENYDNSKFIDIVRESKGQEITFEIVDFETYNKHALDQNIPLNKKELKVTPRMDPPQGEGPLGISVRNVSYIEFSGANKLFTGFGQSLNTIQSFGYVMKSVIDQSVDEGSAVPVANTVGGPIGIFEFLRKIIDQIGFWGIIELMILFSLNLAILNILPIPALDGGHVLFTLLEIIFRRRLPAKIYNYLTIGGFVLLMGFMLFTSSLDLIKHTNIRDTFCPNGKTEGFLCQLTDYR